MNAARASFHPHTGDQGSARFTDWLQEAAGQSWDEATDHRFIEELANDTIAPKVYAAYLVQDHLFLETLVELLGHLVATAPDMSTKRRFVEFLDTVTDEENGYFERSFEALGVDEAERQATEPGPVTQAFEAHLLESVDQEGYPGGLSVLVAVEWVYLAWATRVQGRPTSRFYLDEWVSLHANPGFEAFVTWLRQQLDALGPRLSAEVQARVRDRFVEAVELEVAFWEQAYGLAEGA